MEEFHPREHKHCCRAVSNESDSNSCYAAVVGDSGSWRRRQSAVETDLRRPRTRLPLAGLSAGRARTKGGRVCVQLEMLFSHQQPFVISVRKF